MPTANPTTLAELLAAATQRQAPAGSPRTQDILPLDQYQFGHGAWTPQWLNRRFQMGDIQDAYRDYVPSPPTGGMVRGVPPPQQTAMMQGQDEFITPPYWSVPEPGEIGRERLQGADTSVPPGWVPPGLNLPAPPPVAPGPPLPEYRYAPRQPVLRQRPFESIPRVVT